MIQLSSFERLQKDAEDLEEQLENLLPEAREELISQRRAAMSEEMLELLEMAGDQLSVDQHELRAEAQKQLVLNPLDFANYIAEKAPDKLLIARKLVNRIIELRSRLFLIRSNRQVSNYEYWEARCKFEQTADAIKARELGHAGRRAFRDADLLEAQRLYEASFELWASALADFPALNEDIATGGDIMEYVLQYRKILEQLELTLNDEEIDERFPLWDFLDLNDSERDFKEELEQHRQRVQEK